jgi:hypothetical protein
VEGQDRRRGDEPVESAAAPEADVVAYDEMVEAALGHVASQRDPFGVRECGEIGGEDREPDVRGGISV